VVRVWGLRVFGKLLYISGFTVILSCFVDFSASEYLRVLGLVVEEVKKEHAVGRNREEYIRSGHGNTDDYDKDSMRTIDIDADKGIKAVVACPKGNFKGGRCAAGMEVVSYLFAKSSGWDLTKAKEWFEKSEKEKKPKAKSRKAKPAKTKRKKTA